MKCSYIAIEREYGSGGTEIARRLSEESGVPYYGREILEKVSKDYGIPISQIEKYEEKATSSFLYTIYCLARAQSGSDDLTSNEGKIFLAEQSAIKNFAERGRAIFLGHCAAEALKDKPHTVKVFIRGDEDDKKQRIVRDYGIDEDRVEETMHHIDKRRAGYYYANTACRFDDINSYDLILNSSVLGIDGCVKNLKTLF